MIKNKQMILVAAASAVVLIAGGILVADVIVAPTTTAGAESPPNAIINVGQTAIGRSSDAQITAHMGAIPIYAFRLANAPDDCTANGVVDLEDFNVFEGCLMGPNGGLGLDCDCADLDDDLDTDLHDAAQFMQAFSANP